MNRRNARNEETTLTTVYDVNPTESEASTTKNVYGIYDMSGGTNEYVMEVIKDNTSDNPISGYSFTFSAGYSLTSNSGYSGELYESGPFADFSGTTFPNIKYFDLYEYGATKTDTEAYRRGKYGDATFETKMINANHASFTDEDVSWFMREGNCGNTNSSTGPFYSYGSYGGVNSYNTARAVLTITN